MSSKSLIAMIGLISIAPFARASRRGRDEPDYLVQVSGFDDGKTGKRRLGIGEGTICGGRLS